MKKSLVVFILCCISSFVFAMPSLNFTPPPGDYSVVFLSNIFGVVDGVLHGTGSQMLGQLFAVFNSAVIALGGILIMYTLIVSTMNTAHEGQFLGQKWSSIWVPVRSVTGIALLMPKASGYCMIQIFVMWVCVQGIGAADKVWEAALSYLNRGGAIIAEQVDAKILIGVTSELQTQTNNIAGVPKSVVTGAAVILEGQVCMLFLQRSLEKVRAEALAAKQNKEGICYNPKTTTIDYLCQHPVPDFLASVNVVAEQQKKVMIEYTVKMPNITGENNQYAVLNGICGSIAWNAMGKPASGGDPKENNEFLSQSIQQLGLSPDEVKTFFMTRAIAIQQMYESLATISQSIVNNIPLFTENPTGRTAAIPEFAWKQFGEPLNKVGQPECTVSADRSNPELLKKCNKIGEGGVKQQNAKQAECYKQSKEKIDRMRGDWRNVFKDGASSKQWREYCSKHITSREEDSYFNEHRDEFYSKFLDEYLKTLEGECSLIHPSAEEIAQYEKEAKEIYLAQEKCYAEHDAKQNLGGCTKWGPDPIIDAGRGSAVFNGTEIYGALSDYVAVMKPSLSLMSQAKDLNKAQDVRKFINKANQDGWIMAGSYFYKLARLNQAAIDAGAIAETESGLDGSKSVLTGFGENNIIIDGNPTGCDKTTIACLCENSSYPELCQWLGLHARTYEKVLFYILSGKGIQSITPISAADVIAKKPLELTEVTRIAASTIGGFLNNSIIFAENIASQPGNTRMNFIFTIKPMPLPASYRFPDKSWSGCSSGTFDFDIFGCVQAAISWFIYNVILNQIVAFIIDLAKSVLLDLVLAFITVPLSQAALIFLNGVSAIQIPNINPLIGLANMGVCLINGAFSLWISGGMLALVLSLTPWTFPLTAMFLAFIAPITGAWVMIMMTTGYSLAYYVPFIPYMIFTFGALAWMMAILEAMVAAPIVALGVSSPEGDQAFGKGEHALMLLLNVFLRPAMMIIGYIGGIMLSFVGVKLINAGFQELLDFVQRTPATMWAPRGIINTGIPGITIASLSETGYPGWAGSMSVFFMMLLYTTIYTTVVQESFNLITSLPDKILRWIGGAQETIGGESARWGEQAKQKLEGAGADTAKGVKGSADELQKIADKNNEKKEKAKSKKGSIEPG